ncbi:regulator of G-protein signaling 22-like isoform X2 [Pecten maximus]|uniref:regulator of G-protein signaling 22-like isoform X2 n=1 Tax=Pecten maximus TaxID=6579 RepID=UPI001458D676|nr:regulator of G-protein signaling 22-like isoform X2 [Pecten maximus]
MEAHIVLGFKTLEDFLATDELFVEYFNAFLTLPTFPVPLYFNKETGGFEVATDAKKELSKKIKAAIRSQKHTSKIYRVVKKHSFIDIPLIPIEEPEGPENVEINTTFTVTTLNREQGIHWVKEVRLPAFLESDLYLEFRLAKLISQSQITGERGEFVLQRIDFIPRAQKVKKEEEEEVVIDPREQIIKDMYVCVGEALPTQTEAWFAMAQGATTTHTTYSTQPRPKSAADIGKRPNSARPVSAYSAIDSYNYSESGLGMSVRGSVNSSMGRGYQVSQMSTSEDEDVYSSKLFATDGKPMTPRPSEMICCMADEPSKKSRPFSATVYSTPKYDADGDNESGLGIEDDKFDLASEGSGPQDLLIEDDVQDKVSNSPTEVNVVFRDMDDLGAALVGAVLKRSIAYLTNRNEIEIAEDPDILKHLPPTSCKDMTLDMIDRVSLVEDNKTIPETEEDKEVRSVTEVHKNKDKKDEDSDADSLLDSEDDYEERDLFFRRKKQKTFKLTDRKGIEAFKLFLQGTAGEKNWHMWLDIDRIQFLTKGKSGPVLEVAISGYLNEMRELYHRPGAVYELTVEQKKSLGLSEPASWTLERLQLIHNKIAEPLVLYWAPRFLLKQSLKSDPAKNELYHNMSLLRLSTDGVHPNPPTTKLLPLRPKSCVPKITTPQPPTPPSSVPLTSPPVGYKRVYAQNVLSSATKDKKKELITPRLQNSKTPVKRSSIGSASSSRPSSAVRQPRLPSARPVSALPAQSTTRPVSARPVSARPSACVERQTSRTRPSSAGSTPSTPLEQVDHKEVESLLQTLHHERIAGGFFRKYVEKTQKRKWINCLNFWTDLQEFHLLFYADSIDPAIVTRKAKILYSQYIVVGSSRNIGCSSVIFREIYRCLEPAFEDLFDEAEELALSVLLVPWVQMINSDMKTYGKVELIEVKKHLETKSKYVLTLQKKGLIKERVITPDDPMDGYEDPVYDENLINNIPDEFKDHSLDKLVHNRIELEHFRNFLSENYASMDLLCWMEIEQFRRMPQNDERRRDDKARELKNKFLNKKYFFGPNSPAGKAAQDKIMADAGGWGKLLNERPPNSVLLEAQKYVRERLEKKWLPLFLVTPAFAERQKPNAGMDDVVDDVMVQKRKKSQAVLKLLESRWISSSKEIITFRSALLNPITALQFRRYVSIKGDTLENDVLFWLEVQRFKDVNHTHSDETYILGKINAIINCFIDSPIPPSLQIDITGDMAERILEHKYERNPYLFRESQCAVFRTLFQHWNDFCEFRSNVADDKVLPTIERRRRHAKIKERQRQKMEDEKALKENNRQAELEVDDREEAERRAALGLAPGDDLEAYHDPFAHQQGEGSEMGEEEEVGGKDKISWSYSNYMNALHKEDILNNTDESTFSSLMSDSVSQKGSDIGEKGSVMSTRPSDTINTTNSSAGKKETKSEHSQTDKPERKKSVKISDPPQRKCESPAKGEVKGKKKPDAVTRRASGDVTKMEPLKEETEEEGSKSPTDKKVKGKAQKR